MENAGAITQFKFHKTAMTYREMQNATPTPQYFFVYITHFTIFGCNNLDSVFDHVFTPYQLHTNHCR